MVRPLSAPIRIWLTLAVLAAAPLSVLADSFYSIPHLAVGRMGDDRFATQVIITNSFAGGNASEIAIHFRRPDGANWSVPVTSAERPDLNGTYSRRTFAMGGEETVTLDLIADQTALTTGWLSIAAEEPLTVSAVFTVYTLMGAPPAVITIRGDVGVPPATVDTGFRLNFTVGSAAPWAGVATDYGLALANPCGRPAQVTLMLYDTAGTPQGTGASLTLDGFQQTARFLAGLFPEVDFGSRFTGRLEIRSDTPIAPLALKVSGGSLASVPLNRRGDQRVSHIPGNKPQGFLLPPTLNELPAFVSGQVDVGADPHTDRYWVYLTAGENIVITPIYYAIGSSGQLTVRLSNPSGTPLITRSTDNNRDPARMVYTAAATGRYTVEVWGTPPTVAPNAFRGLTTYHLHVTHD